MNPISIEIFHLNIWELLALSGEEFYVSAYILIFILFAPLPLN